MSDRTAHARGSFEIKLTPRETQDPTWGHLVFLAGWMKIVIEPGGKHFYEIDYELNREH
jgi:hypothetical protein